jgi:FkbM family methyltransferase
MNERVAVGANLGNPSKTFLQLGAHVVAFEPQVSCAALLSQMFEKKRRFRLVRKVLGPTEGSAVMFICDTHTISSLSKDWIDATKSFEVEVLKGLSRPIEKLSIEVVPEYIDNAFGCLRLLEDLAEFQFQFSFGESMQFAFAEWTSNAGIREWLKSLPSGSFGDLYARLVKTAAVSVGRGSLEPRGGDAVGRRVVSPMTHDLVIRHFFSGRRYWRASSLRMAPRHGSGGGSYTAEPRPPKACLIGTDSASALGASWTCVTRRLPERIESDRKA